MKKVKAWFIQYEAGEEPEIRVFGRPVSRAEVMDYVNWRYNHPNLPDLKIRPATQEELDNSPVEVTIPRKTVQILLTMLAYYEELEKRVNEEHYHDQQEWINDRMSEQVTELGGLAIKLHLRFKSTGVEPNPEELNLALDQLKRDLDGPFPLEEADTSDVVTCKFCERQVPAKTAHLHDGGWVGDECCWDERLRSTE